MSSFNYDFNKEEEVKEYIENLGIEYKFECYGEKKPDGCHRLADYFEAIKKDFERAGKIYKHACGKYNNGKSCYKYANYLILGKGGILQDMPKAIEYYEKGCENDCKNSCYQLGVINSSTKHLPTPDYKKGINCYEKACELEDIEACFSASAVYTNGNQGVEKDPKKAFKYASKACGYDNIYACANLSRMYKLGFGVELNDAKAQKYKNKVLDLQEQLKSSKEQMKFGEGR